MRHKLLILMTALVLAGCAGKTRTNNTQATEPSATENTAEVEPLTAEELAKGYDWSRIERVFSGWGRYGWITDVKLGQFGFWDHLPRTQKEADEKVLAAMSDRYLTQLREELTAMTSNPAMFREVCFCFDHECYFAAASLLTSLIDGVLTSTASYDGTEDRKTGKSAGRRVIADLVKHDFFGFPGYFNLEVRNYNAFISTFFACANGFEREPSSLNRNYLHHGMSSRTISREDCLKLLMAYRKPIAIAAHKEAQG